MPACPEGHDSADPDWCDVCGRALAAPAPAPAPDPDCAVCGAPLGGRFCERCGHDSAASTAQNTWRAVVRADPVWFEMVSRRNGTTPGFPRHVAERRFVLAGEQLMIGRRSRTRGTAPDIDLGDADPAVSAAHALLVARPDGGWDLVDLGSTNGTTLAGADGPVEPHVPVALADGAVIHLGAWTTITIVAATGSSHVG